MFCSCFTWEGAQYRASHRENLVLTSSRQQPGEGAAALGQA